MDDLIALRATLRSERSAYFLTWGRLYDPVDAAPLLRVIAPHVARMVGKRDEILELEVCDRLSEAMSAPYFFEAFFHMCQNRIPYGANYEEWAVLTRQNVEAGKDLYFLGL